MAKAKKTKPSKKTVKRGGKSGKRSSAAGKGKMKLMGDDLFPWPKGKKGGKTKSG